MEYQNHPELSTNPQSQSAQQPTTPRVRGRRQYAAQQYDFNVPAAPAPYDGQTQYPMQAYQQQPQPAAPVAQGQYAQPQGYPAPYPEQVGQQQATFAPNAYQGGYSAAQPNVAGLTNQMQNMSVAQVDFPYFHSFRMVFLIASPLL